MSDTMVLLRAVLGVLAAYHLAMGVIAVTSPAATARVSGFLYGAAIRESPHLRYAIRMLGLYALAIGSLLLLATWSPSDHREVIVVVAGLQLARAICRVAFGRDLDAGFGIKRRRNYFNASLLVAESCVLALTVPAVGG